MQSETLVNVELPLFNDIKPEDIKPDLTSLLTKNQNALDQLLTQRTVTWNNLIKPLEDMHDALDKLWAPVEHLHAVMNNEAWRKTYSDCMPILTDYFTALGQNQKLYKAIQSIADSDEFKQLDKAQQQVIKHELRDFKLAGVTLSDEKKQIYASLKQQLAKLTTTFENNLLDATRGWTYHTNDKTELKGLPDTTLEIAHAAAKAKDLDGWLLTLDIPVYHAVATYADNEQLRKRFYEAYSTRASDQGPNAGKWDNSQVIDDILTCRHELAHLLGLKNYAEYSLSTKMAETPKQVLGFIDGLVKKSKSLAENELKTLEAFAKAHCQINKLNIWDVAYYAEKLQQHEYNISQEELRPYFPESTVKQGMFNLVERLYNIHIQEKPYKNKWREDVKYYEVKNSDNKLIAAFFTDLYTHADKRGGAWMAECQNRRRTNHGVQIPVAFLNCNFTPPTNTKPCLLTHDEVITLFHEFGHGLQHMLTNIDYAFVSGINGVPWDAVELPSQFMENFCWKKEVLSFISKHYKSGEPLPDALLEKMLAAKNFHSGLMMLRQLELATFDFNLYLNYQPNIDNYTQKILDETRKNIAVMTPPAFNRFQNGFSHIFAGGYAAGYYSYKWAEVLSSDAFSRFEDEGLFNTDVAQSFLNNILEKGGSEEAMDLFKKFRGREPKVDSLLRHSGITNQ